MRNSRLQLVPIILVIALTGLLGASCSIPQPDESTPTLDNSPTASPIPDTPQITPSLTSTALPPTVILLAAEDVEPALEATFRSALSELTAAANLQLQTVSALSANELGNNVRLVVALPPIPELAALITTMPETQFLAVGIPGLPSAPNLSSIGADGDHSDQQGFLAGYVAALLTPDWRVGILSPSNTDAGQAAQIGFINGAVYYCGLCRPAYPPFHVYPLYAEAPSEDSAAGWQSAADLLIAESVETIYLAPGAGDQALLDYLAQKDVYIIGSGMPPEHLRTHWIASIYADPIQALYELWPSLLEGQGDIHISTSLSLTEINPDLFSEGRQRLAFELLSNLEEGYIDTGWEP